MTTSLPRFGILLVAVTILAGCASSKEQLLATDKSQLELRSIQSRAFDMTDREKILRTIIVTLQDLGFVLDHADSTLGSVSGTKLDNYALKLTVTVRPRGETQFLVRANAQFNLIQVNDPEPYQQFFNALAHSLFLEAHAVE